MNPRPRGRYKRKKRDLILYLKITLICYLAIFGVAYMSSDTSANFSSQSVLSGAITAGIWEVPEVAAIACGKEETVDKATGDESVSTEVKATEATVVTVIDPVTGEEVVIDCGDLSDATDGEVETGKSKEVDCKKPEATEATESTEKVTIDCKEEEKEEAAENAEVPATEKDEEEKATEDNEAPAVDEEKAEKEEAAEEVKTPVNEKEGKATTPENSETPAIEKEKEAKLQSESITEEKAVNKEDGAKTGADESKESEVPKSNTESPIPTKSNDESKSDESSLGQKL